MRLRLLPKLLLAAGAITAVISIHAASFTYSYTFSDGTVAAGTFAGTLSGNLVSNLSNVTLKMNGTIVIPGPFFIESFDNFTSHYVDSGGVVSLDGTQNNFLFANSDAALGDRSYTGYFGGIGDFVQAYYLGGNVAGLFEKRLDSSWSVIQTSPAGVPDADSTLPMFGSVLVALAVFRPRSGRDFPARIPRRFKPVPQIHRSNVEHVPRQSSYSISGGLMTVSRRSSSAWVGLRMESTVRKASPAGSVTLL